jgi:hypothetical protein
MEQWISEECAFVEFGDKRLNERYTIMLENLYSAPDGSIPSSCGGWTETMGAYRFLHNPKVTPNKIMDGHIKGTKERLKELNTLLLIQDTSSIDYTGSRSSDNLGHLEDSRHRGLFVHPTIAVTTDRINLGLIDFDIWTRDLETIGKKSSRKQKPIEEKESYRWLKSYKSANELAKQNPGKKIISIGDRESDIYESFEEATQEDSKAILLVRAAQNRRLAMEQEETRLLWPALEASEKLGEKEISIPATRNRPARNVILEIKAREVTIKSPYRKGKRLKDIKLWAVLVVESNPPSEKDKIEWLLLTTLQIRSLQDALDIVEYYSIRWQIEIYFRTLKGGCQIEELQLEDVESLENAIAIYMVIAWRIQYLLMLGRQCPDLPSDIVFSEPEWKVMFVVKEKPIPEMPPSLNEIIIMIASIGGYLGRKHDGPPGVQTFWTGLMKLWDYATVYEKMTMKKDVYNR